MTVIGHLVDAGLGAGLVFFAAGRPGHADCADDLVTDLDRQGTLGCDDAAEVHGTRGRVVGSGRIAALEAYPGRRPGLLPLPATAFLISPLLFRAFRPCLTMRFRMPVALIRYLLLSHQFDIMDAKMTGTISMG